MNSGMHWTDEQMIQALYGVGPEDGHLDACASCRERLGGLSDRRAIATPPVAMSDEFFGEQRRAILHRIREQPTGSAPWWRWPALASAAAAAVLLAFLAMGPAPEPQKQMASSDDQLFQDIHQLVSTSEPEAIGPLHNLFDTSESYAQETKTP